jgi:O-antigen ligase
MSTGELIFGIISWLLIACGLIGIFGMVIFIPWGIVKIVKANKEVDEGLKNKGIKKGVFILLMPIILVVGSLILVTVVNLIRAFLIK